MEFSNHMELEYADDATSMETTVEVVDPVTGESNACTWDNLTSAMYFIVLNGLKPEREGLRDLIALDLGTETAASPELQGLTTTELMNNWRANVNLPVGLYIQCKGDPRLLDDMD